MTPVKTRLTGWVRALSARISTRRRERHQTDALLSDVLSGLGAQVAVIDRHGTIIHANHAWRAFAETVRKDGDPLRVGANYVDAWRQIATDQSGPARAVLARLEAVLANGDEGGGRWVEYPCLQAGRMYEIEIAPLRQRHAAQGGAVISQRDDTARQRAVREVEEQRRDSAHTARVVAMGGLTASLAHELNQPLTAILSNAQTAQRHLRVWPARTDELQLILVDIVADVTRAGEIIDRMRGLLKKAPISTTDVDLNDVVRTVTKLLASDAVIRQATVTPCLEPNLPLVRADRVQIEQVVLNLVLNALEAMERTHATDRRVTVSTGLRDDATQMIVSVSDTGPGLGVAPDRGFEPFHSTKAGGLGVGLSIARMIVEAHGGSLSAENNDAGGATFHVRLPTTVRRFAS